MDDGESTSLCCDRKTNACDKTAVRSASVHDDVGSF